MSDFKKPTVYNPRRAEDHIVELKAKVDEQMWAILKLKEENTNLKLELERLKDIEQIVDTQHNTIQTYQKIFAIQNAELKRYKEGKQNETN